MEVPKTAVRLSLAYRDLDTIPAEIVGRFAATTVELDLSNNAISDLLPLREFSKLELLVIDSNRITSHTKFPSLPNLKTLWVNKNKIDNLALFIDKLVLSCPNLKFLSMLQNEACPNYFTSGTPKQYQDYRYYVVCRMRTLHRLDDQDVSQQERDEAVKHVANELSQTVTRDEEEKKIIEERNRQKLELKKQKEAEEAIKKAAEEKLRRKKRREAHKKKLQEIDAANPGSGAILAAQKEDMSKQFKGFSLPDPVSAPRTSKSTTKPPPPPTPENVDAYQWSDDDADTGDDDWTDEDDKQLWDN